MKIYLHLPVLVFLGLFCALRGQDLNGWLIGVLWGPLKSAADGCSAECNQCIRSVGDI